MATTLQGALLCRYGTPQVAEGFCSSRLSSRWTGAYGTLPPDLDLDAIITRAIPTAPEEDG
jgi:putative acyl-CoA dehydrogenase